MEEPVFKSKAMREDLLMGGVFLLMYVLVYGSISLRCGLVWDEMLDAEGAATGMYVAAGRWGLALYRCVFGEGISPLVAPLAAGVFIAASLVWQTRLLGLRTLFPRAFYGGIYLACIQWAYQLEYSHQCDAVALGLLGSTAAVWCMLRRRWLPALAVLVLSVGMYQTVVLHTLCLLLAVGLSARGVLRPAAWAGCFVCTVGALALSMGLARAACLLPWVDAADAGFQTGYQTGMSRWSGFPLHAPLAQQADFLWYYGSRFFKMTCKNMLGCAYAGQWVYATALVPLAFLLGRQWRKGFSRTGVWVAAGCLALWALPFCPILLLFSDQGPRVNMAEPLALASLWGLALPSITSRASRLRLRLLVLLLVFALIKSAYRVGDIAWNEARVFEQECACVRALHSRGMGAAEAAGLEAPEILLLGHIPAHREVTWPRRECFDGRSAMTPPEQLDFYKNYLQIHNIRKATPEEALQYEPQYKAMLSWPAAGSVLVVGDCVIIRVD